MTNAATALSIDNITEIPEWMTSPLDLAPDDEIAVREDRPRPRGLYDLPIFGAFWAADGGDLRA